MLIIVQDHVVPQILTSALEAYEIKHPGRSSNHGSLETIGLLWGYHLLSNKHKQDRLVVTHATVETSAIRHRDYVAPDFSSVTMKRQFMNRHWPELELVGTFHSHPYENLQKITDVEGWKASDSRDGINNDISFWSKFHKETSSDLPCLMHLIVGVTALSKNGWALPNCLTRGKEITGYVVGSQHRKFWINSYLTRRIDSKTRRGEFSIELQDNLTLEIPSLSDRFLMGRDDS